MIVFPRTVDEASAALLEPSQTEAPVLEPSQAELRAGGTDLQVRRHSLSLLGDEGLPALVDLRDVPGLDSITAQPEGAWIGAKATLQAIADHPSIRGLWPALADACGALANPQIRAVATIAGNLMQAPRCWYYRHPELTCLRQGGSTCLAREGDHLWHVCFDRSPCAAPHPSTVALALVAHEAEVELALVGHSPARAPVLELVGMLELPRGSVITAIHLGPPLPRERTAYVRASNRAFAEWALVEVTARLVVSESQGTDEFARVAAGAVAPTQSTAGG